MIYNKMSNIKKQLQGFSEGEYIDSSGKDSWCYNFYDWFCATTSLQNKAKKLFPKVKTFCNNMNIDTEKHFVFFKNNCPMHGRLYDDFRICDVKTGNVVFCVIPSKYVNDFENEAEIWGDMNTLNSGPKDFGTIWTGPTLRDFYKELLMPENKSAKDLLIKETIDE